MKLNIGSMVYDLKLVPEIPIESDQENVVITAGYYMPFDEQIQVSLQFPHQIRKVTLWHEVVHAMLDELGLNGLMTDEGFVDALAKQIYGFLEKNDIQKLYDYLGDKNGKTVKTKAKAK